MSDWQEVWACPRCGTVMAMGDTEGNCVVAFSKPPTCSVAHTPVEMEQRLQEAIHLRPEDAA